MIGVVVVTHGKIGEELCAAVEHVLGTQRQLAFVSVDGSDNVSHKQAEVAAAIEAVRPEQDEGVIVLTDMVGCTPSNLASRVGRRDREIVVTGVNLPMLVTIAKARERGSLSGVVRMGIEAGRKYIDVAPARVPKPQDA
jgi:PTS system mannose-specific IIA component